MYKIAKFAIRRRWLIVFGWIGAIGAVQLIAAAMGGASYSDNFTLPHTETQTVSNLLAGAGLDQANNADGTVVLHAKSGTLSGQPAGLAQKLAALCADSGAPCNRSRRRGPACPASPANEPPEPAAAARARVRRKSAAVTQIC